MMSVPNSSKFVPSTEKTAFECPHCQIKTTQFWHDIRMQRIHGTPSVEKMHVPGRGAFPVEVDKPVRAIVSEAMIEANGWLDNGFISICMECGKFSIWFGSRMQYPVNSTAPPAHPDLPENLTTDYNEAARILSLSPRGSAALLRLVVEKLCHHLGYKKKNINENISKMVEDGLPSEVERALDIVRVVGNEAVHPGQLDLTDDVATASKLFEILNYIVVDRITRPKELQHMFDTKVPQGAKDGIAQRKRPDPPKDPSS